jgi:hypothetical protein
MRLVRTLYAGALCWLSLVRHKVTMFEDRWTALTYEFLELCVVAKDFSQYAMLWDLT